MQSIDALTDEISDKVSRQLFDAIERLLAKRQQLFSELTALQLSHTEMITLRDFIAAIQRRDQQAMQNLQDERNSVQDAMVKTNKLKGYF